MELSSDSEAITVAIYAALTYDIISATNSSPQTTEINAAVRAETLMKWVKIGLAQAAFFAALGVALDKKRWPPVLGAGIAAVLLWIQYVYARNARPGDRGARRVRQRAVGIRPNQQPPGARRRALESLTWRLRPPATS